MKRYKEDEGIWGDFSQLGDRFSNVSGLIKFINEYVYNKKDFNDKKQKVHINKVVIEETHGGVFQFEFLMSQCAFKKASSSFTMVNKKLLGFATIKFSRLVYQNVSVNDDLLVVEYSDSVNKHVSYSIYFEVK